MDSHPAAGAQASGRLCWLVHGSGSYIAGATILERGFAYRQAMVDGSVGGHLIICPTPIGNLGDVTLRELIDAGARPRATAGVVAKLTGLGANELYRALI
ncbi:MAG: hypothetical protein ACRDK4_00435 [Solirubrobacteraceae bacterium]